MPKREKAKILAAMQKVNANSADLNLAKVLEDEHTISATIAKAHDETCDYTHDKVAPLIDAARSRPVYAQCPPQMVSVTDCTICVRVLVTSGRWEVHPTMPLCYIHYTISYCFRNEVRIKF